MSKFKVIISALILLQLIILSLLLLVQFELIKYVKHDNSYQLIRDMDISLAPQKQDLNSFFPDSINYRLKPKNSIAINAKEYYFDQTQFNEAIPNIDLGTLNYSAEAISRGKNRFEVFCVPCHGSDGKGRGSIITKYEPIDEEDSFPPPSDLSSEIVAMKSNEHYFHILKAGQNLMMPHGHKISDADIKYLIVYIRELQKKQSN